MSVTPFILGSGSAGKAIAKSLATLAIAEPALGLEPAVWLKRGESLSEARAKAKRAVLVVANPHGLHSEAVLAGEKAGFDGILCEKPACVTLEQIASLRNVKTPTAIFHVYRQTWGVQTLRQMVVDGKFGELIAVEGRYWQSSTAERAMTAGPAPAAKGWKDDPRLSGDFDVYLDLGTHWVDAATFLLGEIPARIDGWRSYANATTTHRDSHVQLTLDFPGGARGLASFSKTVHGATNGFEIHLVGSKSSASWNFLSPDEISIGEGRDRRVMTRKDSTLGSRQWPFHGMGWVEGYIEISAGLLREISGGAPASYPRLGENLDVIGAMLGAKWR